MWEGAKVALTYLSCSQILGLIYASQGPWHKLELPLGFSNFILAFQGAQEVIPLARDLQDLEMLQLCPLCPEHTSSTSAKGADGIGVPGCYCGSMPREASPIQEAF